MVNTSALMLKTTKYTIYFLNTLLNQRLHYVKLLL